MINESSSFHGHSLFEGFCSWFSDQRSDQAIGSQVLSPLHLFNNFSLITASSSQMKYTARCPGESSFSCLGTSPSRTHCGSAVESAMANTVWVEPFFLFVTLNSCEVTTVRERLAELYYIAWNVGQWTDIHLMSVMLSVSINYMMQLSGTQNIIFEVQYVSLLKIILFGIVINIVSCFLYP